MKKHISFLLVNTSKNEILIVIEKEIFLIFEGNLGIFKKSFNFKNKSFHDLIGIFGLNKEILIFSGFNNSYLFFDYFLKKIVFSIKLSSYFFFSDLYYSEYIFFFLKKNFFFFFNMNFFFEFFQKSFFVKNRFQKKTKNKRSTLFRYKNKIFPFKNNSRKKKIKPKIPKLIFFSCFIWKKITINLWVCLDLSSRRIIFEIINPNLRKTNFFLFFLKKIQKLDKIFFKKEFQKNKKTKPKTECFNFLLNIKKVHFFSQFKNFSIFWLLFFYNFKKRLVVFWDRYF
ncbi:hypothetical protein CMESO_414 (nucleomorph) [Chroomonas mesostigmatica CCMP1168]|uniref:Uncharacterized protein n=1 Tax=Chroomonas mesostigmatica CCMP1168 TaxID=1195612 RepID=J7G246_9CRYP|nr:hypothetical protein CMESO_414 [Chroomonas mesostigmatica CCMP1168]